MQCHSLDCLVHELAAVGCRWNRGSEFCAAEPRLPCRCADLTPIVVVEAQGVGLSWDPMVFLSSGTTQVALSYGGHTRNNELDMHV